MAKLAINTTSVANLAYNFFTGSTPYSYGLDYLVSPAGGVHNQPLPRALVEQRRSRARPARAGEHLPAAAVVRRRRQGPRRQCASAAAGLWGLVAEGPSTT